MYAFLATSVALLALGATPPSGHEAITPPSYCAGIQPPSASLPGATTYTYGTIGGRPLRVHVFQPATGGRHPAVLLFFGGGFRTGDVAVFVTHAKALAAHGYVAAIADYRVQCRDGATAAEGVDDAQAAHGWLLAHADQLGVDRRRVVLMGGSAGGELAAAAALREPARDRPAALVLFNPVLDLTVGPWAEAMTPAQVSAYSASKLRIDRLPPTIIFHGMADATVPIATSREFCQRATAAGRVCELVQYPGLVHSFYMRHDRISALGLVPYDDTMTNAFAFLDRVLQPARSTPR